MARRTAGLAQVALALGTVAAALVMGACREPSPVGDLSSYNLLLVTIDTLRADRLGAYGHEGAATPNLDRLAAGGVRFANVYSPVPLTLPTHATLFTGHYPFSTGVRVNGVHYLDESAVTLAERLRQNDYDTAAFVAAYVLISRFGLAQGFDRYEDSLGLDNLFRFTSELRADEIHRRFADWLHERRARSDAGKFFAWLHFYDPHLPYDPPAPYADEFSDSPYDGEIAFVDSILGRALSDLEEDALDNTLVVVTSDHGEAFGEHVERGHGLLTYDETLRVPLIFWAPGGLPRGLVVEQRVSLVDVMPTLLELLGLEDGDGDGDRDGRSLRPLLAGRELPPRDLYFESLAGVEEKGWAPRTGVVAEDMKFIDVPRPELYDLVADPAERRNLLVSSERAGREKRTELERRLRALVADGSDAGSGDAERDLDAEDRRQLTALGYLSTTTAVADSALDPKRGIEIDMRTRDARTLVQNGHVDRAEAVLSALRAANSDVEVADFYEIEHEIHNARGDVAAADAALAAGVTVFPEGALALKLAAYRLENGRLDEAERLVREILRRDPRMSQAVNLLGMAAEKRGQIDTALERFEEALALEPTSIPLRLRIADLQSRLGRVSEALEIYERLLESGALDESPDHLYRAATLNTLTGQLGRAEELFRRGITLAPAGRHYLALAMVQMRARKPSAAGESLETALARFRDELAPAEIQMAEALLRQARATR